MSEVSQTQDIQAQITQAYLDLEAARTHLAELRRQLPCTTVADYQLTGPDGASVKLSSLFGDQSDMIVIHNMGTGCAYCTLWADGFNGVVPHFENRAAFVVISPDDFTTQQAFALERGWRFRMVSSQGTTFRADLGFQTADDLMPGYTVLHKDANGTITDVGKDFFGPGDNYSAIWHMFDLLPEGLNGWEPQFHYE